jgi:hypothetical protein
MVQVSGVTQVKCQGLTQNQVKTGTVGYMISLATGKQLLKVFFLGWKDSPDDAMILVVKRPDMVYWQQ